MPRKSKHTVIEIKTVDVDRFNSGRPNRKCTKTPHGYIGKGIAFEAKIGLQIFSGGVTQHDLPPDCQQNRTMENGQKRHAHGKRRRRATPWSARPRFCLTVFGHQDESISTLTKKKAQMTPVCFVICCVSPPLTEMSSGARRHRIRFAPAT